MNTKTNKFKESAQILENAGKRAILLDEVRGFAIICMVVYHIMFSLEEFYNIDVPIFFDSWFYTIWAIFAGSFIFISGIVCRYSKNNIKRGAQCFLLGMIVTFVTATAAPEVTILFGILHFMGICMILYGLGEKLLNLIPPFAGFLLCFFLLSFTWCVSDGTIGFGGIDALSIPLPRFLYDAYWLFPLGFFKSGFYSGDYFPLFPWMFLFFAGSYFGVYVKGGRCPKFFYTSRVPFLSVAGRYTIWIYLLHQPIAMGILYLIFGSYTV